MAALALNIMHIYKTHGEVINRRLVWKYIKLNTSYSVQYLQVFKWYYLRSVSKII